MKKEVLLGRRSDGKRVLFPERIRTLHSHVIGAPGKGKSKFLEGMIRRDILNGTGTLLLDPHGSLYDNIVTWGVAAGVIPEEENVLLFEPRDEDFLFGFNPLNFAGLSRSQREDALAAMVRAVGQLWGHVDFTATPTLARCLPAALYALSVKGLTLREGAEICQRGDFQQWATTGLPDESYRQDWEYLHSLTDRELRDEMRSTYSRLIPFRQNTMVRGMVTQTERTLDFKRVMDEGGTVLINLAKLSEDNKRILGVLMMNDVYTRGLQREVDVSPFFSVVLDEAYYFFNEDIERILFGLRKFGVGLTIAHHTLSQLEKAGDSVRDAVLQIQNKIMFGGLRVPDARELAEQAFVGEIRLDEVKHVLDKPTVVGYVRDILNAHSSMSGGGHGSSRARGSSSGSSTTSDADGDELATAVMDAVSELSSQSDSSSWSETDGWSETLRPILKTMPTATFNLEEQIFKAVATMVCQPTQYVTTKLSDRPSEHIRVPYVRDSLTTAEFVNECKRENFEQSYFAAPIERAEIEEAQRRRRLFETSRGLSGSDDEPDSYWTE